MHNRMVFPSLFHRTVSGNPHLPKTHENPVISAHIIDGGRETVKMRTAPRVPLEFFAQEKTVAYVPLSL